jgi:hypothetical protein
MSLEQIEAAILQLSPEEFRQLAKWFVDLDYQHWERLQKLKSLHLALKYCFPPK